MLVLSRSLMGTLSMNSFSAEKRKSFCRLHDSEPLKMLPSSAKRSLEVRVWSSASLQVKVVLKLSSQFLS